LLNAFYIYDWIAIVLNMKLMCVCVYVNNRLIFEIFNRDIFYKT